MRPRYDVRDGMFCVSDDMNQERTRTRHHRQCVLPARMASLLLCPAERNATLVQLADMAKETRQSVPEYARNAHQVGAVISFDPDSHRICTGFYADTER